MASKITLALGTALAGIALCCFIESGFAQDAVVASIAESENDDVDHDNEGDDKSRRRRPRASGSVPKTDNPPWANVGENRSLAITNIAQTPTPSPAIDANGNVWTDTMPDASEADHVVVTGSNIGGSQSPDWVPESIYTREAIEIDGSRSLGDFMRSVPQNSGPTFTENQSDSLAPGAAAVALHGLSPDATLVLVNGRRVAPYPFAQTGITAFVDLNSIPLAAIQQMEVLRDGASAIYGADAAAGVINNLVSRDFVGRGVSLRGSVTQHGGANEFNATLPPVSSYLSTLRNSPAGIAT